MSLKIEDILREGVRKLLQQAIENEVEEHIEQDHRFVKKRVKSSLWFQSFKTAKATISEYETMHMI